MSELTIAIVSRSVGTFSTTPELDSLGIDRDGRAESGRDKSYFDEIDGSVRFDKRFVEDADDMVEQAGWCQAS